MVQRGDPGRRRSKHRSGIDLSESGLRAPIARSLQVAAALLLVLGLGLGTWKVTDNDVLCAKWVQPTVQHEVCDLLSYTGDKSYEWNGNSLVVIKGNPKNL